MIGPQDRSKKVRSKAILVPPNALTTPGIHTAIIGIGQIEDDPKACQLQQNLSSAQISPDGLSTSDRTDIEKMANKVKEGKTNYFQLPLAELTAPQEPELVQETRGEQRVIRLTWHTAYAGNEAIKNYEIWKDNQKITEINHQPQISKKPFVYEDKPADKDAHQYKIITVDEAGRKAASEEILAPILT